MALSDPFVTVEEVVANSAAILPDGAVDARLRNLLRQWTYLGERQLGFSGLHEKVETGLVVSNLTLTKPTDYAIGIDMALFDDNGNEYIWHYQSHSDRIHNVNSFLYNPAGMSISNTLYKSKVGVGENPYSFKLDTYGEGITQASLRYFSYPLDSSGDMLIPENHLLALMMFNKWMYSVKMAKNQNEIQLANEFWLREQTKAKSKNKVPSMLEGRDIARHHMSMIEKVYYEKY